MRFLHTHPEWPSFLWDAEALSGPLAAVRFRQGQLLGRMGALEVELQNQATRLVLTSDTIHSAAIDGTVLPAHHVEATLARRPHATIGAPPAGSAVEGAVAMLLDATRTPDEALTRERLFAWHECLHPEGRAGPIRITVGAWRSARSDPMRVTSGPANRERVHLEAPAAARVAEEMDAFLHWFNSPPTIDPVLMAGTAHLWFLTIRPFECGNGRLARAITQLAMARADGTHQRCYALCTAMDARRQTYLQQLEAAQRGDLDISPWLKWFIGCVDGAIQDSASLLAPVHRRASLLHQARRHPSNRRQRLVLERMSSEPDHLLTNAEYAALAKCSPDSALRDIRQLVQWGLLARNASGGRSTSYRLAP